MSFGVFDIRTLEDIPTPIEQLIGERWRESTLIGKVRCVLAVVAFSAMLVVVGVVTALMFVRIPFIVRVLIFVGELQDGFTYEPKWETSAPRDKWERSETGSFSGTLTTSVSGPSPHNCTELLRAASASSFVSGGGPNSDIVLDPKEHGVFYVIPTWYVPCFGIS